MTCDRVEVLVTTWDREYGRGHTCTNIEGFVRVSEWIEHQTENLRRG